MLIHRIITRIERSMANSWLNPLATLYLNFRCLSFKEAIRFPIYVYGRPKFLQTSGRITIDCPIKRGLVHINQRRLGRMTPVTFPTEMNLQGNIVFKGRCYILSGAVITVRRHGELILGDDVVICEGVSICSLKSIQLGNHISISHKSQIFDSSFHYMVDFNTRQIGAMTRPIRIGNYCWIGNSCTITAGAEIPNLTTVASNSLVNKKMLDIPPMSVLAGTPCKLVKSGTMRVWCPMFDNRKQSWIKKYFRTHPDAEACAITEEMDPNFFLID